MSARLEDERAIKNALQRKAITLIILNPDGLPIGLFKSQQKHATDPVDVAFNALILSHLEMQGDKTMGGLSQEQKAEQERAIQSQKIEIIEELRKHGALFDKVNVFINEQGRKEFMEGMINKEFNVLKRIDDY
jgi:hypothetical protein